MKCDEDRRYFLRFPTKELLLFRVALLFFTDLISWVTFFTMVLLFFCHVELEIQHLLLYRKICFLWYSGTSLFWDPPTPPLNKSLLMLSECLWEGRVSPWKVLRPCLAQTGSPDGTAYAPAVIPTKWNSAFLIREPVFRSQLCHLKSVWLSADSFISLANFPHLKMDTHDGTVCISKFC